MDMKRMLEKRVAEYRGLKRKEPDKMHIVELDVDKERLDHIRVDYHPWGDYWDGKDLSSWDNHLCSFGSIPGVYRSNFEKKLLNVQSWWLQVLQKMVIHVRQCLLLVVERH